MTKNSKKTFLGRVLFLNDVEDMLHKRSQITSRNKTRGWYSKNLLIPIFLIFAPYLSSFFISTISLTFVDVILNGGLTILGVSILYSNSSYLVRTKANYEEETSNYSRNEKIFESLSSLRDKILTTTNLIVLFSAFIYFIQIVYKPENNIIEIPWINVCIPKNFILLLIILFFFWVSTYLGKKIFEISDEFITESSNYEAIYNAVEEQKKETEILLKKLMEDSGI